MNGWPTCVGNFQPIKTSSIHVIYLRDTSQNGGRESTLFKFIEAVHNYPVVRDVSSIAYKDAKNAQNRQKAERARGQTGFRPNLSNSPPLSVSSLLFLCFTVVRECHCTKKSTMLQIIPCLLFDTSLTCEGKSLTTF